MYYDVNGWMRRMHKKYISYINIKILYDLYFSNLYAGLGNPRTTSCVRNGRKKKAVSSRAWKAQSSLLSPVYSCRRHDVQLHLTTSQKLHSMSLASAKAGELSIGSRYIPLPL